MLVTQPQYPRQGNTRRRKPLQNPFPPFDFLESEYAPVCRANAKICNAMMRIGRHGRREPSSIPEMAQSNNARKRKTHHNPLTSIEACAKQFPTLFPRCVTAMMVINFPRVNNAPERPPWSHIRRTWNDGRARYAFPTAPSTRYNSNKNLKIQNAAITNMHPLKKDTT